MCGIVPGFPASQSLIILIMTFYECWHRSKFYGPTGTERYSILLADLVLDLFEAQALPLVQVLLRLAEFLDGFDPIHDLQELLIGLGILDHEFRLAVDGEHDRLSGLLQLPEELDRVPLETREPIDVPTDI